MTPEELRRSTAARLRGWVDHYKGKLPTAWRYFDEKRAGATWPEWCFCPTAYAETFFYKERRVASDVELWARSSLLSVLAAWRATQGIYVIDETVCRDLWEQDFQGNLPTDTLTRLPEWCVYVTSTYQMVLPCFDDDQPLAGFFVSLDYDEKRQAPIARFVPDVGDLELGRPIVVGLCGTLADSADASCNDRERLAMLMHGVDPEDLARNDTDLTPSQLAAVAEQRRPLVNVLQYLCSSSPDMPPRPPRPKLVKTKNGPRLFNPDAPKFWEVGYRIGAALRKHEERAWKRYEDKGGMRASPRPHKRRAGWHHYWTGSKAKPGEMTPTERKLVVKWRAPQWINVTDADELVPTIHEVKL